MPDETAVLELPATAAEEPVSPSADEQPETEQALAPETDAGLETPESETETDPLADLDDEALTGNERIKSLVEKGIEGALARERESARRSAEHQQNLRAQQEREDNRRKAADGTVSNELLTAIRNATGDDEFKWDDRHAGPALQKALTQYGDFYRQTTNEAVEAGATQYVQQHLGTALSPEHVSYLAEARASGNPAQIAFSYAAVIAANAFQKGVAEGRKAAEADREEAAKTDAKRASSEAKRAAPTPSRAGSGASPASSNRAVLDSAEPGSPEWRKAYRAEHGIDP